MDTISTEPPNLRRDPEAEAAKTADAVYASILAMLARNGVVLYGNACTQKKAWGVVTDKSTDEAHRPGCSQPTQARLICSRLGPTGGPLGHPHGVRLRFEWGRADRPLAALELWFMKGLWFVSRITSPELVNWPGPEERGPFAVDARRSEACLAISEDMAAYVANLLVRTYERYALEVPTSADLPN